MRSFLEVEALSCRWTLFTDQQMKKDRVRSCPTSKVDSSSIVPIFCEKYFLAFGDVCTGPILVRTGFSQS